MTLCGIPAEARSNLKSLERLSPYVFTIYTERLDDWFRRSQSEGSRYLIGDRHGASLGSIPGAVIPVKKYNREIPITNIKKGPVMTETGSLGTFLTMPVPLFRPGQGALPCSGIVD